MASWYVFDDFSRHFEGADYKCTSVSVADRESGTVCVVYGETFQEAKSRAAFIADAPAMLDALRNLHKVAANAGVPPALLSMAKAAEFIARHNED